MFACLFNITKNSIWDRYKPKHKNPPLLYSYKIRVEEGFSIFFFLVFGNVWSCSTLFIMKTSHKSDELKNLKKKGGVHKSGTYELKIINLQFAASPLSTGGLRITTMYPSATTCIEIKKKS